MSQKSFNILFGHRLERSQLTNTYVDGTVKQH